MKYLRLAIFLFHRCRGLGNCYQLLVKELEGKRTSRLSLGLCDISTTRQTLVGRDIHIVIQFELIVSCCSYFGTVRLTTTRPRGCSPTVKSKKVRALGIIHYISSQYTYHTDISLWVTWRIDGIKISEINQLQIFIHTTLLHHTQRCHYQNSNKLY